ncbi:MAG: hypothetical protein NT014_06330 [Candidatus Omnitrophica bacterium]|nr:hypothetical protein [Candidatus Omnitrophota bacterium]
MIGLRIIKLVLVLVLVLGIKSLGFTEEPLEANKPKKVTQEKILEGKVVAITSNFIAINYGLDKRTSYEMALTIDKDTKVERKNSLKEIIPGEGVWIKYAEISEVSKETVNGEERSKTRVLTKLARVVRFMSPVSKELQSFEEIVPFGTQLPKEEGPKK